MRLDPDDLPPVLQVSQRFYDIALPIARKTIRCSIFDPLQVAGSAEHSAAKRRFLMALTKLSRVETVRMVENLIVTAEDMSLPNDHPLSRHLCSVVRDFRREAPSQMLEALPRAINLRSIEYVTLFTPFRRTLILCQMPC